MTVKLTLERILRDDDDASAQTVRGWALSIDTGSLSVRRSADQAEGLLIRLDDVGDLIADLNAIADAAEAMEGKA